MNNFTLLEEKAAFLDQRDDPGICIDRATEICLHELNQLAQGKPDLTVLSGAG